jgi:hypothetical protein
MIRSRAAGDIPKRAQGAGGGGQIIKLIVFRVSVRVNMAGVQSCGREREERQINVMAR